MDVVLPKGSISQPKSSNPSPSKGLIKAMDDNVIDEARRCLNEIIEKMYDLPDGHIPVLGDLEAIREPLLTLRCKLQRELYEKREQLRMPNYKYDPKDKDTPRYTDFDRRTMLEAQTAEINERYELVKGLEELVKERVDLIKILLGAK